MLGGQRTLTCPAAAHTAARVRSLAHSALIFPSARCTHTAHKPRNFSPDEEKVEMPASLKGRGGAGQLGDGQDPVPQTLSKC